jgi:diadenosine tetraphosphatase ApaH/serine/threonine PP2A family protein phosphatase
MRIAVISDIHANLAAFHSALAKIDTLAVEKIFCLGDIVGYGPRPNECVDLVRERCAVVIKGNHDSGVIGETPLSYFNEYGRAAIVWTTETISRENRDFIEALDFTWTDDTVTLVHASPNDPPAWNYVFTWEDARECFHHFATELCFIGHTHVPFVVGEDASVNIFRPDFRCLINVGSIGQPRDGNPNAAFGLLDTERQTYESIRVEYDIQLTAAEIRKQGLPGLLAQRLFRGI